MLDFISLPLYLFHTRIGRDSNLDQDVGPGLRGMVGNLNKGYVQDIAIGSVRRRNQQLLYMAGALPGS